MRRNGLIPGLLLGLLLLLVACGEDPPTPPPPAPAAVAPAVVVPAVVEPAPDPAISEKWYAEFMDGQQTGWLHVVWTESEFEGRKTIHDHTESYTVSTRGGGGFLDRFEVAGIIDVERTVDGDLLTIRSEEIRGQRRQVTEQRFTGSGYTLTSEVAGLTEAHEVKCEGLLPTDAEAFLSKKIREGAVRPGEKLTYPSPNFLTGAMETVVLDIERLETLALPTGPCLCYRVRESMEGRPGESTLWLDEEGVLRKARTGRSLLVSTTRERAQEVTSGGHRYSIVVLADPPLPRITSADRSVVTVTLDESEFVEDPVFPKTPFSRVTKQDGRVYTLELLAHDDPRATVELPVADESLAKWLTSTNLLCADAPEVQAAAKEAIGDVTDGREAVVKLLHYVFTRLDKGSGPIPAPTAKEILADGKGDCSEHAVLFVALCRAVGLPARLLSGYAQVGQNWGSHSFTEIWLGKWIGADPTTNELGTRARYIAFGWLSMDDSYPGLVSSQVAGRMRIETNEFEEGGAIVDLSAPPEPRPDRDLLSGLAFAKPPEGWKWVLGAGSGSITGPGVSVDVQIAHGWGDLPPDILKSYLMAGGEDTTFGGLPAVISINAWDAMSWVRLMVPYRRRTLILSLQVEGGTDLSAALEQIEKILAPTLR
jgi:transglutaminase-like putative cysteine protease